VRIETLETVLEAAKRPEAITEPAACRIAQESFRDARADLKRFQNLVYITACFAVAFVVAGIVLVALGSDTRGAGIVSFVGTAVTGLGVKFVIDQRNDARKEKRAAEKLVRANCERHENVIERLEAGEPVGV
jgi:hypothetical protein